MADHQHRTKRETLLALTLQEFMGWAVYYAELALERAQGQAEEGTGQPAAVDWGQMSGEAFRAAWGARDS